MKINVPEGALSIIKELEASGFEAYAVGGCVRDSFLGLEPKDWDICTNALPEQVKECLKGWVIIPTGLKHGTVTVVAADGSYEITTYRTDGNYSDGRHPDFVSFGVTLKDDLERRDFTVNAMAYNPRTGIIDLFGGMEDLRNKALNCVGNSDERFAEDALRIMRAVRFASVYGFEIGKDTKNSILKSIGLLGNVSQERKSAELCGFLMGKNCKNLLLEFSPVFTAVIPELSAFSKCGGLWEHTAGTIDNSPQIQSVRIAALFHDIAKPYFPADANKTGDNHAQAGAEMTASILRRLKFDSKTINAVRILVLYHEFVIEENVLSIRTLLNKLGKENLYLLLELKKADMLSRGSRYAPMAEENDNIKRIVDEIITEGQCYRLRELAINGDTLIAEGFTKGKIIGDILNDCLDKVIEGGLPNNKDSILKYVNEKYKRRLFVE